MLQQVRRFESVCGPEKLRRAGLGAERIYKISKTSEAKSEVAASRCEVMPCGIVKYCALHKVKLSAPLTFAKTSLSAGQLRLRSKLHAPKGALN